MIKSIENERKMIQDTLKTKIIDIKEKEKDYILMIN